MSNRLSGALFEQFQQALIAAFPSYSDLEQMVRIQLSANLNAIAVGTDLTTVTRRLITYYESRSQIQRLVDAALADNPTNDELIAFNAAWRTTNQPRLPADILVHDPATIESLSDAKLKFLFFVYIPFFFKSKADETSPVDLAEVQNSCRLTKHRAESIARFLAQKKLIEFKTDNVGIRLLHKGIIAVESRVLRDTQFPDYIGEVHRIEIQKRVNLRYEILRRLFQKSEGCMSTRVWVTDLATEFNVNSRAEMRRLLLFLDAEQWVKMPNTDQAMLTEKGLDYFEFLSSEDDAFSDVI